MKSSSTRKRTHDEANGAFLRRPLKPELVRRAYEECKLKITIANKTGKPINVSFEVGNSWDWEIVSFLSTTKSSLVLCERDSIDRSSSYNL